MSNSPGFLNQYKLGNYVHKRYKNGTTAIGVVLKISLRRMTVGLMNKRQDIRTYSGLEPIKINEEWLRRLGSEDLGIVSVFQILETKTRLVLEKEGDCYHCSLEDSPSVSHTIESMSLRPIRYVHELQNLYYALTGDELRLK